MCLVVSETGTWIVYPALSSFIFKHTGETEGRYLLRDAGARGSHRASVRTSKGRRGHQEGSCTHEP